MSLHPAQLKRLRKWWDDGFVIITEILGAIESPEPPEVLTVREFAILARMNEETVRTWCSNGRIKAVKLGGTQWRIPREEFLKIREKLAA